MGAAELSGVPGVEGDGSVEALDARTVPELRVLRTLLQRHEDDLSLLRRLVQGRLDIVRAEQDRRRSGGVRSLGDVLADLPVTLAGPVEASVPARATRGPADRPSQDLCDELDQLCGVAHLRRLPELSDDELGSLGERLVVLERSTSQGRQQLHRTLDAVSAELAHRYASGEASVDDLLAWETGDR